MCQMFVNDFEIGFFSSNYNTYISSNTPILKSSTLIWLEFIILQTTEKIQNKKKFQIIFKKVCIKFGNDTPLTVPSEINRQGLISKRTVPCQIKICGNLHFATGLNWWKLVKSVSSKETLYSWYVMAWFNDD